MKPTSQWKNSRKVVERITIKGKLVLDTPAHFGAGDENRLAAITLQMDALEGRQPLLPGASIAGALRSELRQREKGYGWNESSKAQKKSLAEQLFGCVNDVAETDTDGFGKASVESWLMVDDALGTAPAAGPDTELRDGVAIDAATRTVEEDERGGHKFDIELLAAGTSFEIAFEFWLTEENEDLLQALASALTGFEEGRIGMGKRKNRGFGKCHVEDWQVWRFAMGESEGLLGWLEYDGTTGGETGANIAQMLGVDLIPDARVAFSMQAAFKLDGSLLIRSEGEEKNGPDMTHLRTWRDGEAKSVLSGTSLAGVVRGRALRIAKTCLGETAGIELVDEMFGKRIRQHTDQPSASQVKVEETLLGETLDADSLGDEGIANLIQQRVKIDRFTGGAYPQALFSQQPVWGKADAVLRCTLNRDYLEEDSRFDAKVGLMLHVLKDLWTGDLAVGGDSSVGRGRLAGYRAILDLDGRHWELLAGEDGQLTFEAGAPAELEVFAKAFNDLAAKSEVNHG